MPIGRRLSTPVSPARAASRGHFERALESPEDRGLANLILGRQLGHGLAVGVALGDLALLADIQRGGPAELLALSAGLGDADLGAGQDQFALKLGDAEDSGQRADL